MADPHLRQLFARFHLKISQIQHLLARLDRDARAAVANEIEADNANAPLTAAMPNLTAIAHPGLQYDPLLKELSVHLRDVQRILKEIAQHLNSLRERRPHTDAEPPAH